MMAIPGSTTSSTGAAGASASRSSSATDVIEAFKDALSRGSSRTGRAAFNIDESIRIQYLQQLAATYIRLWSERPPPGYINRAAAAGMNLAEFEAHERAKPAFERSPTYQEERVGAELQLARTLGAMG